MEPKESTFECQLCGLTAPYSYYGQRPPNAFSVTLLEDCYVMRDPFTSDKDTFLILGAQCSLCHKRVCVGPFLKVADYEGTENSLIFCPVDFSERNKNDGGLSFSPRTRHSKPRKKMPNSSWDGLFSLNPAFASLAEKICELFGHEPIASDDCSLFYSKRFCLPCVNSHISEFPLEIEEDLKKKAGSKSSKKDSKDLKKN